MYVGEYLQTGLGHFISDVHLSFFLLGVEPEFLYLEKYLRRLGFLFRCAGFGFGICVRGDSGGCEGYLL